MSMGNVKMAQKHKPVSKVKKLIKKKKKICHQRSVQSTAYSNKN
jgi:hypothetical protein